MAQSVKYFPSKEEDQSSTPKPTKKLNLSLAVIPVLQGEGSAEVRAAGSLGFASLRESATQDQ